MPEPTGRASTRCLACASLDLSFTDIKDDGLARIPLVPKLRELMLTGVNVNGSGFTAVGNEPALEELWVKDTQVTNDNLRHISMLSHLRILSLPGTKVGPGALRYLRPLQHLDTLYLGGTEIIDDDLSDLQALPRLKILYLPQNPEISDAGLRVLAPFRPCASSTSNAPATPRPHSKNSERNAPTSNSTSKQRHRAAGSNDRPIRQLESLSPGRITSVFTTSLPGPTK